MVTKLWAMGMVLFCTILTSTAQIFWKIGSETLEPDIINIISNINIWVGIVLYVIGGFLLIISFRGGEVSVLYPIIATSYIWVSILSVIFLGEFMSFFKWLGVFTIISGIVFIGLGSKTASTKKSGVA